MTGKNFLAEMAALGASEIRLTDKVSGGLRDVALECRHVERGKFRATVTFTQDTPYGFALEEHLHHFREQLAA